MLKKFFTWLFDLDNTRSTSVIKTSVTGIPLVILEVRSYKGGWRIRNTPEGLRGGVAISLLEVNFTPSLALDILHGEYDDCFTVECKERALMLIKKVLDNNGRYSVFEDNGKGILEVTSKQLSKPDALALLAAIPQ